MIQLTPQDFIKRIKEESLAPFFGENGQTPQLDAFLTALATSAVSIDDLEEFVKLQIRIFTATGEFLDLAAQDYFGHRLKRRKFENDESYRIRILANLVSERVTGFGLYHGLLKLTGRPPILFEPWNAADSNHLNGGLYLNNDSYYLGGSFNDYRATGFIIVFRPIDNGTAYSGLNRADYSINANLFLQPAIQRTVTDEDIMDLIGRYKAEGVRIWVYITD